MGVSPVLLGDPMHLGEFPLVFLQPNSEMGTSKQHTPMLQLLYYGLAVFGQRRVV